MESCNIDSTGSKSRLAWTSATEKKNQCTKSAERTTLYDIAKQEYATKLMEGVGKIPVLTETKFGQAFRSPLKEGWALLRPAKKKYRFNEKKKIISQTSLTLARRPVTKQIQGLWQRKCDEQETPME